jgi:LysR family glycine cleavage system transcriptional activator
VHDVSGVQQHHFSDARLAIEGALLGHGIALGDTLTAASLLTRGQVIVPFKLAVPAVDAFYVACSNDVRSTPAVEAFIDWLFSSLEEDDAKAEPMIAARRTIRRVQAASPVPDETHSIEPSNP